MADQIFKKETDYNVSENNFIGESEITVTITLNEYRHLVSHVATRDKDVKKAEAEALADRIKAQETEKKNAELKAELYELKKKLEAQNGFIVANEVVNLTEGVEARAPEETVEVQSWEHA